ncbi:hypothetical protein ACFYO0_25330 [Streptomyces sp. NPDC006365]|uniref:hypothetical protein n=1 Tax=Streptomyces sp. NPDC006365 TaxID=3364744 RepID=UPI0036BFE774
MDVFGNGRRSAPRSSPERDRTSCRLNFRFQPPLRWLAEPLLRRPFTAEAEEEMRLAKEYIRRQKETS